MQFRGFITAQYLQGLVNLHAHTPASLVHLARIAHRVSF